MDLGHATFQFPVSSGQHRLWVLSQLRADGEPDPYLLRSVVRARGPLHEGRLQRALDAVVAQHDALRTGLALEAGRVVQQVHERAAVILARCDASAVPERRAAALSQMSQPFDLTAPPLLRSTLVRLDQELHELHIAVHHAVCDGWSLAVVLDDLVRAYTALGRGEAPVGAAPIQFPDYVVWQDEQLTPHRLADGLRSFREELSGLQALPLPVDRSGTVSENAQGAVCEHVLDAATWAAVHELAARHGTTPFAVSTTALGVTLARLTGATDLCIGVAVSGRVRPETRRMVGLLMNTLPVRLRFDRLTDDATLEQAIEHGASRCAAALAHQEVPYAEIQRAAASATKGGQDTALFRVMCLYQEFPPLAADLDGLTVWAADAELRSVRSHLTLVVSPTEGDGCRLALEYATALVDADTARCWLDLLVDVLTSITIDPSRPWRSCGVPDVASVPRGTRLTRPVADAWQHFLERANENPSQVAVESWEQGGPPDLPTPTTYAELSARVGELRRWLRQHGMRRGQRLGVQLPRSRDVVTALLACLAEGITYVPLDPAVPAPRREQMIEAAAVCAVLEPEDGSTGVRLVLVSSHAEQCASPDLGPEGVAYVIFTSGSTGTPKGVEVTRGSLNAALDWMVQTCGAKPGSRWAAVSSVGFDISLVELLCPVLGSSVTLVVPEQVTGDGPALAALLRECAVDVMQATPSTWQLLRGACANLDPRLRVLSGGEPLPASLAEWLVADGAPSGRRVTNLYGPTEATIWVSASDVAVDRPVTLGECLPGAGRQILDATLRPVPTGAVGELHLSGTALARGYRSRPRETASAFIPDPSRPGARIYRTGDLVRVLPTGDLCFVGRTDDQVKVRGHRQELGEIEAILTGHPDVLEAVAVAIPHDEGDIRLVAAVVAAKAPAGEELAGALRAHLGRFLAVTVVPRIVWVDRLPRTTAGKVDRAAVRREVAVAANTSAVPPTTAVERAMSAIFEDVLKIPVDSTDASFFDLGGHSLLVASLLHKIHDAFGVTVSLRNVFDNPTVAALVAYIEPRMLATSSTKRERENWGALEQLDEQVLDQMLSRMAGSTRETVNGT